VKKLNYDSSFRVVDALTNNPEISDDMLKVMSENIKQTYAADDFRIETLKAVLSKDLYERVQKQLFVSLTKEFKLFNNLTFDVLSLIYCNLKRKSGVNNIFKNNSIANNLIFVVAGSISCFDSNYTFTESFEANQMLGVEQYNM